jgi:hypothetical protein
LAALHSRFIAIVGRIRTRTAAGTFLAGAAAKNREKLDTE